MSGTHIDFIKINALVQHDLGNTEFHPLETEEIEHLKKHLSECDACSHLYDKSAAIYGGMEVEMNRKPYFRVLKYGIAASFLILIGAYQFGNFDTVEQVVLTQEKVVEIPDSNEIGTIAEVNDSNEPVDSESKDEETVDSNTELIAFNSIPNEELEYLIGSSLRSSTIAEPRETLSEGQLQVFWSYNGTEQLIVRIVDNQEKEIFRTENALSPVTFKLPQYGLYYWILETQDEILHTGKATFLPK